MSPVNKPIAVSILSAELLKWIKSNSFSVLPTFAPTDLYNLNVTSCILFVLAWEVPSVPPASTLIVFNKEEKLSPIWAFVVDLSKVNAPEATLLVGWVDPSANIATVCASKWLNPLIDVAAVPL